MSSGLQAAANVADLARAVGFVDEEVKEGAVVPEIHRRNCPFGRDIGHNPTHSRRPRTEACLGSRDRCSRYVEDRQTVETTIEERIDQSRVTAADIDHAGARAEPRGGEKAQRREWDALEPTDSVRLFGFVNLVPMFFHGHRRIVGVSAFSTLPRCIPRSFVSATLN